MSVAWERRVLAEEHIYFPETKIAEDACEAPRITFSENSLSARKVVHGKMEGMYI